MESVESKIEFTMCFCLTFRLMQIEMAELISLIYDIAKGDSKLFLSCFSEKPCLNSPWRGIFVFWRKFSSTVALISEILLVLLKVITIVVNLQKKKTYCKKKNPKLSIPWIYNGHGKDYQLRGARSFPNWPLSHPSWSEKRKIRQYRRCLNWLLAAC